MKVRLFDPAVGERRNELAPNIPAAELPCLVGASLEMAVRRGAGGTAALARISRPVFEERLFTPGSQR